VRRQAVSLAIWTATVAALTGVVPGLLVIALAWDAAWGGPAVGVGILPFLAALFLWWVATHEVVWRVAKRMRLEGTARLASTVGVAGCLLGWVSGFKLHMPPLAIAALGPVVAGCLNIFLLRRAEQDPVPPTDDENP
jgi:hypothetical protein